MKVSKAAENRRLEQLHGHAVEPRLQVVAPDRPLLSYGEALADEQLLAKLAEYGVKIDRERLGKLVKQFPSAEAMTYWLLKEDHVAQVTPEVEDWCWISLTTLWLRWFPEHPNFERLDQWIQEGLAAQTKFGTAAACAIWMRAWQAIAVLLEAFRFDSIEDFDDCFSGTTGIEEWVPDFVDALGQAARDGVEWSALRMAVSEQALRLHEDLSHPDEILMTKLRLALAQSQFDLGNLELAERWFAEAARESAFPERCYEACARAFISKTAWRQLTKAEVAARRGLKVARPGSRVGLLTVLIEVCDSASRPEEAAVFRQQLAVEMALSSASGTTARAA